MRRRAVLGLARAAVEAAVRRLAPPVPPDDDLFRTRRGCFVTLKRGGRLRGCLGVIEGREALGVALARLAAEAALHDPRFPPVRPEELAELMVEVSLLTPPRVVASADEVRPGRDGVIVSAGARRGVYLPQVALETGWSAAELVARCLEEKAGLPRDAVARGDARLEVFEAEIFGAEGDEA